jgi:micrococcal nuclease
MLAPRCWPAVVVVVSWVSLTPAEEFSGKVVGVSDGDTITVLQNRTPIKVRLHGIDCPEIGQDFGSRAKAFASEIVFGQVVKVVPRETDRYGRTVADVILVDGRILNHELVRAGLAWR